MIIPNTKRHPNNTKTDQLPIFEVITGLFQGHTVTLAHPDEPHIYMQKYRKFGEIPIPLSRTCYMSRRCGSSKPTPTPLNGLAMYPGNTRRKVRIEGNADIIMRQPTVKNLPRTASVAGGVRRKRRCHKANDRQKPPADQ